LVYALLKSRALLPNEAGKQNFVIAQIVECSLKDLFHIPPPDSASLTELGKFSCSDGNCQIARYYEQSFVALGYGFRSSLQQVLNGERRWACIAGELLDEGPPFPSINDMVNLAQEQLGIRGMFLPKSLLDTVTSDLK
jgi:hypothetical protein